MIVGAGDERLKPKDDESTCLAYTGLLEELHNPRHPVLVVYTLKISFFLFFFGTCSLNASLDQGGT